MVLPVSRAARAIETGNSLPQKSTKPYQCRTCNRANGTRQSIDGNQSGREKSERSTDSDSSQLSALDQSEGITYKRCCHRADKTSEYSADPETSLPHGISDD